MTLDEAIKRYTSNAFYEKSDGNLQGCLEFEQLAEWLKELKQLKEQESCEDAISRDELLKAIDTWDKFGCDADTKLVPYQDHYIPYIHYDDVVKCIKGMPSVTPKPKTGHWNAYEVSQGGIKEEWLECSECKWSNALLIPRNYCPNCGLKMEVEE